MASTNEIFSLLLVLSFMWYICHPQKKHKESRESFIVGNSVPLGGTEFANQLYRYNNDLEFASKTKKIPLTFKQNIHTQPLPPIVKYES
jgi:hypothetical protein